MPRRSSKFNLGFCRDEACPTRSDLRTGRAHLFRDLRSERTCPTVDRVKMPTGYRSAPGAGRAHSLVHLRKNTFAIAVGIGGPVKAQRETEQASGVLAKR